MYHAVIAHVVTGSFKRIHIYFSSDSDVRIIDGVRANNHLPFCHSEAVAYTNFMSTLTDDGDTSLGIIVSRNDFEALWDEYAGPNKPDGKLLLDYLLGREDGILNDAAVCPCTVVCDLSTQCIFLETVTRIFAESPCSAFQ